MDNDILFVMEKKPEGVAGGSLPRLQGFPLTLSRAIPLASEVTP